MKLFVSVATAVAIFAGLSILAFAGFIPAQGFWWILVVSVIAATCFPAMLPIGESQVMGAVLRHRLDYGRIRLWPERIDMLVLMKLFVPLCDSTE